MISHLKGTVEKVLNNTLIIDVNGIGYKVVCSSRTIAAANCAHGVIHIFTELSVREDAWILYGFVSESERFWFNKLISVQGVGGKVAIAILSALSDNEIYNAFITADKNVFTRAEGVGLKLASRIIIELKDKIIGKAEVLPFIHNTNQNNVDNLDNNTVNDVISALVNLGYPKSDICKIISSMKLSKGIEFSVLLKQVLGKISSEG